MSRTIQQTAPSGVQSSPEDEEKGFRIEIVTPMVGGGAKTGKSDTKTGTSDPNTGTSDPVDLVRVPSIRGHLRFWWRLIRGSDFTNAIDLFEQEEKVWGSAQKKPSSVWLRVSSETPNPRSERNHLDSFGFAPYGNEAYALFAAKEGKINILTEGQKFTIFISFSKNKDNDGVVDEVIASIKAWVNFGGVGGRTRRGCGALKAEDQKLLLSENDLKSYKGLRVFVSKKNCTKPLEAWSDALGILKEFRQIKFRGSKHEKILRTGKRARVPGRTSWPEADSIRRITGCSLKARGNQFNDHSSPIVPEELLPSFPRALFGMPINFKFADGDERCGSKDLDPPMGVLKPYFKEMEEKKRFGSRMASPIIVRPVYIDSKWIPAIIVLPYGQLLNLEAYYETKGTRGIIVKDRISGPLLNKAKPLSGNENAIEAFLSYAVENGYREVKA